MRTVIILFIFLVTLSIYSISNAQSDILNSGPMVGYSHMREVALWVQTKTEANVKISYWSKNDTNSRFYTNEVITKKESGYTALLIADEVEPSNEYEYELFINNVLVERDYPLKFKTQHLWQWREDPPYIKFVTGSCAYINQTEYDRPGQPYGGNYEIFENIYKMEPEFMLWLGDNIYLREVDWNSWNGIIQRYTHGRSIEEFQPLFGSVHHYAIWDDHDFGTNNSDRGFWNKFRTLEAFKLFWANPSYGINGKPGITSYFEWGDLAFFLLDNRYYRSPNYREFTKREILGEEQIEWLIDGLVTSYAPFKFICIGGQFLNPNPGGENHMTYPDETNYILELIKKEEIRGVMFLTGDVHRTELTKIERENTYPLYDFTISPFTASASGRAYPNDGRVEGTSVLERNFGIFEVTGPRKDRTLKCTVYDSQGKILWDYSINENELR
ncbi:alkaline phosphatase D family protein [Bacteroidota bacterium]